MRMSRRMGLRHPMGGYDEYTKLMLHFDGTDGSTTITDSSDENHSISIYGDSEISTDKSKFGGSSLYLDGTSDYIYFDNDINFAGKDWTIDFWMYQTAQKAYTAVFCYDTDTSDTPYSYRIYLNVGLSNEFTLAIANEAASSWSILGDCGNTPSMNAWHHYAIVRNSTSIKVYVDGTSVYSGTISTKIGTPTGDFRIGRSGSASYPSTQDNAGYIDEFRISVGIARWTANFTPPTEAYS